MAVFNETKSPSYWGIYRHEETFVSYIGVLLSSRYSGVSFPELKKIVRTMVYVSLERKINLRGLLCFQWIRTIMIQ